MSKHTRYSGSQKLRRVEAVFKTLPDEYRVLTVLKKMAEIAKVPVEVVEERYRMAVALVGNHHAPVKHAAPRKGKSE